MSELTVRHKVREDEADKTVHLGNIDIPLQCSQSTIYLLFYFPQPRKTTTRTWNISKDVTDIQEKKRYRKSTKKKCINVCYAVHI